MAPYQIDKRKNFCKRRPPHSREGESGRALPTETKVENGTSEKQRWKLCQLEKIGLLWFRVLWLLDGERGTGFGVYGLVLRIPFLDLY